MQQKFPGRPLPHCVLFATGQVSVARGMRRGESSPGIKNAVTCAVMHTTVDRSAICMVISSDMVRDL